ncbi:MAG TPA: glycosyltransferase family 2 protein [Chloroflexota bacterium]
MRVEWSDGSRGTMRVSVVVRTYTDARWDYLVRCISSIEAQSRVPDEIVVVVDHNEPLYERVKKRFPTAAVVQNDEPAGSSGAWNSGIAAASGDLLAFIDDDATAAPDWLEQLLEGYDDPAVVGVGGQIAPVWEDGRPGWFPEEFNWVVGSSYRGLSEGESRVRNLIGCNMSFRRRVFDAAGGFLGAESGIGHNGGSPIGCDETEFCIRVGQRWPKAIMLYRPQARVYHSVPARRATWQYFLARCQFEGRSKARVARLVGSQAGLETERAYALTALPKGVARGVGDLVLSRDPSGLARAGAIVAGLAWTAAGYLIEAVTPRPKGPARQEEESVDADAGWDTVGEKSA